jgi:hypothetical protein
VPSEARIRFADAAGILKALGADQIKDENKVPAGLIEMSNGTKAPCFLDARYLLGPEGAHINISGISGQATKTSYVMFLLTATLQRYADAEETCSPLGFVNSAILNCSAVIAPDRTDFASQSQQGRANPWANRPRDF